MTYRKKTGVFQYWRNICRECDKAAAIFYYYRKKDENPEANLARTKRNHRNHYLRIKADPIRYAEFLKKKRIYKLNKALKNAKG